jgi:phenylalanyl-tRNA synthetase alpha chain
LTLSEAQPDWLIACPGLVYRRDEIDRQHCGEPHQLDLWRVRRGASLGSGELEGMIAALVSALLPGVAYRTTVAEHPYTTDGLQIDVRVGDDWVEIGECGLAHAHVLRGAGLAVPPHSGLALGLGLDRVLMLRKGIPDIRLLRTTDARVASQMLDLEPYRVVSHMPPVTRDLSLMVAEELTKEELGDSVRRALGERAAAVELIAVRGETAYAELPPQAVARMGARPGQKNVLLRVVLRDLERTLTHSEANALRNTIYRALHRGEREELALG